MVLTKLLLLLASAATFGGDAQLLYFEASWCEPCRQMQPILDRLVLEGYPIRKLDVDQYRELAQRYQVTAVPTMVLVDRQGYKMDQIAQATDYGTLRRFFAHHRVTPVAPTVRGQSPIVVADARGGRPDFQPTTSNPPGPRGAASNQRRQDRSERSSTQSRSFASTVRVRVEDDGGHSFGTGTVIDVHGQEALVLTCGHLFRDSQGKGRILLQRFDAHNAEPTVGSLISYDLDRDIALVSMKLTEPMEVSPLATLATTIHPGDRVYSIGCNQGGNPSIVNGQVNQVDKYLGPSNITASGRPVLGRSGGGLFNERGELIGVCTAADPEIDEGLYGALPRVHAELDRNGLSFVYQSRSQPPPAEVATVGNAADLVYPSAATWQPSTITPVHHISNPKAGINALPETRELICVVKSKDGAQTRTYVIDSPSDQLLEQLQRASRP